jgi:hypothetical protein
VACSKRTSQSTAQFPLLIQRLGERQAFSAIGNRQLPTQNISAESNASAYLNAYYAKKRDQRTLRRVVVATEDVFFGLEAQNSDPHKGCLAFSLGTQIGIDVKCGRQAGVPDEQVTSQPRIQSMFLCRCLL